MEPDLYCSVSGSGRPLLMVHGWAMHRGVWQDFAVRLADCCTVIAVDLRGHGAAAALPGPYTFAAMAADLRRLRERLALDRVTAMGWSMGVSVLLTLLQESAPWIDSLVLMSGTPCFVARDDWPYGLPRVAVQRLQRRIERDYPGGLASFHALLLTEQERGAFAQTPAFELLTHSRHAPRGEAARESLVCLADEDLRPAIDRIAVPTLLIHGDADRLCMPAASELMHTRIAGSRLLRLPETGHVPFLTAADNVTTGLRDFLRNLP